ncbi:MAG: hypothetical protein MJZ99_05965 [Bacteroidales bacterium]|nr:hypothetical protein [Candidatus Colimorpha merdihippi]MCQ2282150.1 hypothetical protein [Bacteroidales bacterium]
MNNTFDWNRFGKILRKDITDIRHRFGVTMLIMALLPMAVWIIWGLINNVEYICGVSPFVRWGVMLMVSVLAAMVAPSSIYGNCNQKEGGVYFAMLPASKLEKFLSMLIVSILVCPLMTLCGSLVVDVILTLIPFGPYEEWIWNMVINLDMPKDQVDPELQYLLNPGLWILLYAMELLSWGATFIFTNTIFKRHKFWKTILWIWIISFALQIVFFIVFTMIFANIGKMDMLWLERFAESDPVRLFKWAIGINCTCNMAYSAALILWSGSRLKKMAY